MSELLDRMVRAARLDPTLYKEVEADPAYMKETGTVVFLSSAAAGIGIFQQAGLTGIIFGTLTALVGWFIWVYLICIIGTRLLPGPETRADYGRILRAAGFASSPGLIRGAGVIPGIGPLIHLAGGVWMLAATVFAVRRALNYTSTARAVGVCFIGWIIQTALLWLVTALIGSYLL
jgi:hypothetical protein